MIMKTTFVFSILSFVLLLLPLHGQNLLTPSNGATGVSNAGGNISFDWDDYTFENDGFGENDYYTFEAGYSTGVYTISATSLISSDYVLSLVANNTELFWRVLAYDDGVLAYTYSEFSFTAELGTPNITGPVNNSYDNPLSVNITWTLPGSSAGVTFDMEYHTGAGFPGTKITGITSPYSFSSLTNNTTCSIRLLAIKGSDTTTSSTIIFTTLLATPTLSAPSNGADVNSFNPTFTWTQAGNTSNVQYTIRISTDGGSSYSDLVSGLSTTTYTPGSDLVSSTKYTWKVVASVTSGSNTSKESAQWDFYTPLKLLTYVNGLTGVSIEPTFTWENSNYDAGGYYVEISSDSSSFASNIVAVDTLAQDITTTTFTETHASGNIPLANNTKYYWRVRVNDGASDHFSSIWHFTTIPQVIIVLAWPSSGATIYDLSNPTTFTWSIGQSTGALQFKSQALESSATPTATEWLTPSFTSTSSNLTADYSLLGNKTYYWRVVVLDGSGNVVSYSSVVNFTTSGGATVPTPSYPTSGITVYTYTPSLYWYIGGLSNDLTYDIQVDDDSTFASIDYSAVNINALYHTLTSALSPGTNYYWRVRSIYLRGTANADTSAYSSKVNFITYNTAPLVVPIQSYPTGGITVYTTAPYLYWYINVAATGLVFDIEYNTTNSFSGTPTVNDVSDYYYQLSGLTPGATYYWKVRSDNGSGTSSWSATETFVVAGGITNGYPVATLPLSLATVYTATPSLYWYLEGSSLGLTKYTVRWKAGSNSSDWNSDFSGSADITDLSQTYYTFGSPLTYGTDYHWAVASYDGSSYSAWSSGSFSVTGGTGTPILSLPIGGMSIYSTSTTLYWYFSGSTLGIQGYEVTFSKSDVFESSVTTTAGPSGLTDQFLAISGLTPGATYYWKVRAWYGGSTYSSYSTTESFVVNTGSAPTIQPIVGGPNNVVVQTDSPTLSWVVPTKAPMNATYEIELAEKEDFSEVVTIENVKANHYMLKELESGKTYFWRVRSKGNEAEYSYYSGIGKFRISDNVTNIEEESMIPEEYSLEQNYPNPFNPNTTITVALPEAGNISLTIYNILGKEIVTIYSGNLKEGIHKFTWNGQNSNNRKVSTGAYIYQLKAGGKVFTKKLVLLK